MRYEPSRLPLAEKMCGKARAHPADKMSGIIFPFSNRNECETKGNLFLVLIVPPPFFIMRGEKYRPVQLIIVSHVKRDRYLRAGVATPWLCIDLSA